MRNTTLALMLCASLALFYGCQNKPSRENSHVLVNTNADTHTADTTIYGKCVAGAMSSLEIVNASGDTIQFILETDRETSDVQGGIFEGDKMAIIGETINGELFAKKVINLTSLMGKWTSIDKNFDIKDDGVVESHISAESKPYTSWKILNGKLLLSTDTFEILNLGPDSLSLENNKGIFVYKRQK
ncbi:MAG: lipocalin family protein [Prevotella sp.]|nr:lipocalin family protein [Prevotella sp.]